MKISPLLVLLFALPCFADNALVSKLQGEGFNCATQPDGYICTVSHISEPGKNGLHYTQPVAVVIPKNVDHPSTTQLYLHGFKGVCENAGTGAVGMVKEFHFLEQIKDTNSIMIFPMSSGQCATYNSQLVPQFSKFYGWMNQNVGASNHWILAGHSGAGTPMARILANNPGFTKKVDGTILLDATYKMGNHIGEWQDAAKTNPNMSIASVYTGGGSTKSGTQMLKSDIHGNAVHAGPASTSHHCQVPTLDYGKLLKSDLQRQEASNNVVKTASINSAPVASVAPTAAAAPTARAASSQYPSLNQYLQYQQIVDASSIK